MRECRFGPPGRKESFRHRPLRKDSSRRSPRRINANPRNDNHLPQPTPGVLYCRAGRVNRSYPSQGHSMSWDAVIVRIRGPFRPIAEVDADDYLPLGTLDSVASAVRSAFPDAEWDRDRKSVV